MSKYQEIKQYLVRSLAELEQVQSSSQELSNFLKAIDNYHTQLATRYLLLASDTWQSALVIPNFYKFQRIEGNFISSATILLKNKNNTVWITEYPTIDFIRDDLAEYIALILPYCKCTVWNGSFDLLIQNKTDNLQSVEINSFGSIGDLATSFPWQVRIGSKSLLKDNADTDCWLRIDDSEYARYSEQPGFFLNHAISAPGKLLDQNNNVYWFEDFAAFEPFEKQISSIGYGVNKEIWAKHLIGILQQLIVLNAQENLKLFTDNLEIEWALCKQVNSACLMYNWIVEDDGARKHRFQACEAYPSLMDFLLHEKSREFIILEQAINDGISLKEQLNEKFGFSSTMLNYLNGLKRINLSYYDLKKGFDHLSQHSSFIPLENWPAKNSADREEQYAYFLKCIDKLYEMSRPNDYVNIKIYSSLKNALMCQKPFRDTKKINFFGYMSNIRVVDMIYAFQNQVLLPSLIILSEDILKNDFFDFEKLRGWLSKPGTEGFSAVELSMTLCDFKRLTDRSDEWHRLRERIYASIITASDERYWPALFEPVEINGIWAVPICTASELAQEGLEMNHCVGNYVQRCLTERCHIIGLRDQDGTRLSTLEIKLEPSSQTQWRAEIVQNMAHGNAEPEKRVKNAACLLVNRINLNPVWLEAERVEKELDARSKELSDLSCLELYIGYNPFDEKARKAAFEAWKFALPRNLRNLDIDEWLDKTGVKKVWLEKVSEYFDSLQSNTGKTLFH